MRFGTAYLDSIYESPLKYKRLIDRVADKMAALKKKTKFGAIAFRGTSGAALAYPLSAQLNVPLICIRKATSHGYNVEGSPRNIRKYIIIDDFIATGNTIRTIIKAIDRKDRQGDLDTRTIQCVGIVLYAVGPDDWRREFFTYKEVKIPVHYLN